MKFNFNFGALKKFKDAIDRELKSDSATKGGILTDIVRVAGQRCLSKTIKRTPVDTGQLRKNWSTSDVSKRGFNFSVTIQNPVEYASYVEYGHLIRHRQTVGRYVPVLDKRLVQPYVVGKYIEPKYMLTKSVEEIKDELPTIAEERIKKFLDELK